MRLLPVVLLLACSEPPVTTSPDVSVAAKSVLLLHVERDDEGLEVSGEVPAGELPQTLLQRTKDVRRTIILKVLANPSSADDAALARLAEATALMASGTIDVFAAQIDADVTVRTPEEKAELEAKLVEVSKLLRLALDQDVVVDAARLAPGEGFIKLASGASAAPLELRLEPLAGGPAIAPDSVGRVPQGIYKTMLGAHERYLAVVEQQTTWLPPTQQKSLGVLIGGKRFALDLDVPLIAPGDPGARDITLQPSGELMLGYGARYLAPGKRLVVEDVFDHRDAITQVVLHADQIGDSAAAFDALVARELSMHFMIDWDGTIYQLMDVSHAAYHAGEANQRSIGVELTNRHDNLVVHPKGSAHPKTHPRLAEMQSAAYERKRGPVAEINGVKVQTFGYTEAQYRSLGSLLRLLAAVFPAIARGQPVDGEGKTIGRVLDDPEHTQGVLAHWHWSAQQWDPGPAFDWRRLGLRDTP